MQGKAEACDDESSREIAYSRRAGPNPWVNMTSSPDSQSLELSLAALEPQMNILNLKLFHLTPFTPAAFSPLKRPLRPF